MIFFPSTWIRGKVSMGGMSNRKSEQLSAPASTWYIGHRSIQFIQTCMGVDPGGMWDTVPPPSLQL